MDRICLLLLFVLYISETNSSHPLPVDFKNKMVIEVGLPKSGTSSIFEGLRLLGIESAHYNLPHEECESLLPLQGVNVSSGRSHTTWPEIRSSDGCYIAEFIQKALSEGKDPLAYLLTEKHSFQAFLQIDACRPPPQSNFCIIPQVFALDQLSKAYPDAYYLMTTRLTLSQHAASMHAWANMLLRFEHFGYFSMFPGQSPNNSVIDNGILMIDGMQNITRSYFHHNPHLRFLEICLEDPHSGPRIAKFLGIPSFPIVRVNSGQYKGSRTASPTYQHTFAPYFP